MNPREMKTLKFFKKPEGKNPASIEFETEPIIKGIGKVEDPGSGKVAVYLVVDWREAQVFRKKYGLEERDFHVTLGFQKDDIHDQKKDLVLYTK